MAGIAMVNAATFPTLADLHSQADAVVETCRTLNQIQDPAIHEILEPLRTEITKLVLMASLLAERARFA